MLKKIFLILSIFFFLGNWTFAEIKVPKYQGYVNDYANLFTEQEEQKLENKIKNIEKKTSVEIGILTIESLNGQPLFDYSMAVARGWGIGKKDKNNGLLILIAKKERKIRIEVGYGLEGTITDAQAFWLIDNILKPAFRKNQYFQGVNEVLDKIGGAVMGEYIVPVEHEETFLDKIISFIFLMFVWLFMIVLFIFSIVLFYTFAYLFALMVDKIIYLIIKIFYKSDVNCKDLHPLVSGFLFDARHNYNDLLGEIIYLANRNYFTISKGKGGEYYFNLKVQDNDVKNDLDLSSLKLLFDVKKLSNNKKSFIKRLFDKKVKLKWGKTKKLRNDILKVLVKRKLYKKKKNWYTEWGRETITILFVIIIFIFFILLGVIKMNFTTFIILFIFILFIEIILHALGRLSILTKEGKKKLNCILSYRKYLKSYKAKNFNEFILLLEYSYLFNIVDEYIKENQEFIKKSPKWFLIKKDEVVDIIEELDQIRENIGTWKAVGKTSYGDSYISSGGGSSSSATGSSFGGGSFGGGGASGSW